MIKVVATSHPPLKTWVHKTPAIGRRWRAHLRYGRQPDKWKCRHPVMKVNPKRLALDVDTTEGGTYHDADDGHLFVLVVHEFCLNGNVCAAVHNVIREAVAEQWNVQVCCFTFFLSFHWFLLLDGRSWKPRADGFFSRISQCPSIRLGAKYHKSQATQGCCGWAGLPIQLHLCPLLEFMQGPLA